MPISADTKYDADCIREVEAGASKVPAEANLTFAHIHQFTDGCAAQYKSCKAFQISAIV